MKSQSWKFIDLKSLIPFLLFTILQQMLNAFGTFALAKGGFSINAPSNFAFWIGLALATHILSPLLAVLIRPLEIKTTFQAYKNFLHEKLLAKSFNPGLWAQKSQRETFLASVGAETESYLAAIIYVGLDVFSYILALIFSVLILGSVLDPSFIPAFALSGIVSFIAYCLLFDKVTTASEIEQQSRTSLIGFLLLSWDNIFLKNKSVVHRYHKQMNELLIDAQNKSMHATRWNEGLIAALSTVSAIPVIAVICYFAYKNMASPILLTALLVTIPRQLNLLATFRSLFQAITSYISFETKLKALVKNVELSAQNLPSRITASEILIEGQSFANAEQTIEKIISYTSGRLLVRGKNGAGKSTLLLHLNDQLESSFFVPSNPQLLLDSASMDQSTGQRLMQHIRYVAHSDAKYILLDEWDANLDENNIYEVNVLLNELSLKKVVIEVRHR